MRFRERSDNSTALLTYLLSGRKEQTHRDDSRRPGLCRWRTGWRQTATTSSRSSFRAANTAWKRDSSLWPCNSRLSRTDSGIRRASSRSSTCRSTSPCWRFVASEVRIFPLREKNDHINTDKFTYSTAELPTPHHAFSPTSRHQISKVKRAAFKSTPCPSKTISFGVICKLRARNALFLVVRCTKCSATNTYFIFAKTSSFHKLVAAFICTERCCKWHLFLYTL